jgi:hypothetical protein
MLRTRVQRRYQARCMVAGLTAHVNQMSKWGITAEFIAEMSRLCDQADRQEQERNALKARYQMATARLNQILAELEGLCRTARQIVRIALPKDVWFEFEHGPGEAVVQGLEKNNGIQTPVC